MTTERATEAVRTLPPAVYDALQASAERYGGIGAGRFYSYDGPRRGQRPCCIYGYAETLRDEDDTVANALIAAGIDTLDSDDAVEAINERLGRDRAARVPFAAWAAELGIVRGTE